MSISVHKRREVFSSSLSTFTECETKQHSSSWMVSNFSVLNIYLSNKTSIISIDHWSSTQYKYERYNILITSLFLEEQCLKRAPSMLQQLVWNRKKKKRANSNILGERKKIEVIFLYGMLITSSIFMIGFWDGDFGWRASLVYWLFNHFFKQVSLVYYSPEE